MFAFGALAGGAIAKPPEQSHVDGVQDISLELGMPVEKVEPGLAVLEAQSRVVREVLMRRIAEMWLEGQRKARVD